MNINLKCKDCGEIQQVNENILKKEKVNDALFMYYICKKCKRLHIVQIDSDETIKTLESLKKYLGKIAIKRAKGWQPKKKEINNADKLRKQLKRERNKLNEYYEDRCIELNGNKIIVHVEMQEK